MLKIILGLLPTIIVLSGIYSAVAVYSPLDLPFADEIEDVIEEVID